MRVADIDWIESSRNNVRLHVGKESTSSTRRPPASRRGSTRSSSSASTAPTIVNIERIREIHPWFNGDYAVTLRDGTQLTLSSTYRDRLKEFRRLAV